MASLSSPADFPCLYCTHTVVPRSEFCVLLRSTWRGHPPSPANSPLSLSPESFVLLCRAFVLSQALSGLPKSVSLTPIPPVPPAQPHSFPNEGFSLCCSFLPPAVTHLQGPAALCLLVLWQSGTCLTGQSYSDSQQRNTFDLPHASLGLSLTFPAPFSSQQALRASSVGLCLALSIYHMQAQQNMCFVSL